MYGCSISWLKTEILLPVIAGELLLLLSLEILLLEVSLWLVSREDSEGGVQFPVCSPFASSKPDLESLDSSLGWLEKEPLFELLVLVPLVLLLFELFLGLSQKGMQVDGYNGLFDLGLPL